MSNGLVVGWEDEEDVKMLKLDSEGVIVGVSNPQLKLKHG